MADFSSLKQTIQTYIKQNGNEEITGNILQDVLLAMVSTMGDSAINGLASALQDETNARQNQDGNLQGNITAEATARRDADTALGGRIDGLQTAINGINTKLAEGYIYAGIATPSTNPGTPSGKVFYIAVSSGTYTNFSNLTAAQGINILKYNGSAWSKDVVYAIDARPKKASQNLVTSGGVFDNIGALDVSELNATENPHTLAKYTDLSSAIAAIPTDYQKGGMSIKYVHTSDNKYVQYILRSDTFNTTPANWQGVDKEPTAGSHNLVESGGVDAAIHGENVDFANLTLETSYYINSQGLWKTLSSLGCYIIPFTQRSIYVKNTTQDSLTIAFLKSIPSSFSGSADFCAGTSLQTIASGYVGSIELPSDIVCLYVLERDVTNRTRHCEVIYYGALDEYSLLPSSFDSVPVQGSKKLMNSGDIFNVENQLKYGIKENLNYLFGCRYAKNYSVNEEIVLDDYDIITGRIIDDFYQYAEGSQAYLVPATNIKELSITANGTNQTNYSLLLSKDFSEDYGQYKKVYFAGDAEGRVIVPAGTTVIIEIPEDCVYIYIDKKSPSNLELKPSAVLVTSIRADYVVSEKIAIFGKDMGKPQSVDSPNMNTCLVSYGKENTAQSYWYLPSIVYNSYIHRNLYFSFVDSEGYAGVIKQNISDNTTVKTKLKRMWHTADGGYSDTHDSAFVSLLPDRRVICGYSYDHATQARFYIRVSKKPEDITDFEDVITIKTDNMGIPGKTTYGQYFYMDSKHYVFMRFDKRYWGYIVSEDLKTWTTHLLFEAPIIDGVEQQYYILFRNVVGKPNLLRIAMYAQASLTDTNIRIGYINFNNGNVLDGDLATTVGTIDGIVISTTDFSIAVERPSDSQIQQRLYDLAITDQNTVKILYGHLSRDAEYDGKYYIYENGTVTELCDGGNPILFTSGANNGICFINDSAVIIGRSDKNNYGYDYIERWDKTEGTWSKTQEIYKEQQLQPDGVNYIRNAYPMVDYTGRILIWYRGYYPSYKNAVLDAIVYDLSTNSYL